MSNDGNRICLDATPGNENIEVCDQHGNQVVLHASNKLIKLFAPYKCSGLELGKTSFGADYGVYIYTDGKYKLEAKDQYIKNIKSDSITTVEADYKTSVRGDYETFVRGNYTLDVAHRYKSRIEGLKTEICVGGKVDTVFGGKTVVCLPLKIDVCIGVKCEVETGGKIKIGHMKDIYKVFEKKDVVSDTLETHAKKIETLVMDMKVHANQLLAMNAPVINMCGGNMKIKQ